MKPKVAFIGTGGTIASLGTGPLDVLEYGATGQRMRADEIVDMFPASREIAEVVSINYVNLVSSSIGFADWRGLVLACDRVVADHPDVAGIVIGHGTASLEETAYMLNLTVKVAVPVVLVGSQRPASALGSDAGMNLVGAIRTAASPEARQRWRRYALARARALRGRCTRRERARDDRQGDRPRAAGERSALPPAACWTMPAAAIAACPARTASAAGEESRRLSHGSPRSGRCRSR